jgi:hypothetical protein
MPTERIVYRRALLRARETSRLASRRAVRDLARDVRAAVTSIDALHAATDPITAARAQVLRRQLRDVLQELERATVATVTRARELIATEVVGIHQRATASLVRAATGETTRVVASRFEGAVSAATRTTAPPRVVLRRHIQNATASVTRFTSAATRNRIPASRVRADLSRLMAGERIPLRDYGLRESEVGGLRTVFSDARRVTVSEVYNVARDAGREAMRRGGIVRGVQWQLSPAHAIEDECDELASADVGFGPGVYPPDEFPDAPHPYCACAPGGEIVFEPTEKW